jgi:hypothetical protein
LNKIIEIIVTPSGETKLETKGFAGASCQNVSRFLEQALGQTTSQELTPEFHQSDRISQHTRENC